MNLEYLNPLKMKLERSQMASGSSWVDPGGSGASFGLGELARVATRILGPRPVQGKWLGLGPTVEQFNRGKATTKRQQAIGYSNIE